MFGVLEMKVAINHTPRFTGLNPLKGLQAGHMNYSSGWLLGLYPNHQNK